MVLIVSVSALESTVPGRIKQLNGSTEHARECEERQEC